MSNLTIGKIANNSVTLVLSSHANEVNKATLHNVKDVAGNDISIHTRFAVSVPNCVGFTHKTRCLCHVESVSGKVDIQNVANQVVALGVRVGGMYPQRVFRNGKDVQDLGEVYLPDNQVVENETLRTSGAGLLANFNNSNIASINDEEGPNTKKVTFLAQGDVISNGVLCTTPFGKRLEVEVFPFISRLKFCPSDLVAHLNGLGGGAVEGTPLASSPVTIKLRLLFLDENDLKDY